MGYTSLIVSTIVSTSMLKTKINLQLNNNGRKPYGGTPVYRSRVEEDRLPHAQEHVQAATKCSEDESQYPCADRLSNQLLVHVLNSCTNFKIRGIFNEFLLECSGLSVSPASVAWRRASICSWGNFGSN
ncbi:hypothetical protein RJZ56_002064 [Blastomyces dermatitidis]